MDSPRWALRGKKGSKFDLIPLLSPFFPFSPLLSSSLYGSLLSRQDQASATWEAFQRCASQGSLAPKHGSSAPEARIVRSKGFRDSDEEGWNRTRSHSEDLGCIFQSARTLWDSGALKSFTTRGSRQPRLSSESLSDASEGSCRNGAALFPERGLLAPLSPFLNNE